MRTFELLTVIALTAYLLWLFFGNGLPTSAFRSLPSVAGGFVLVHAFAEGVRWQLIPLYCLVLLALGSYPWCRARSFRVGLKVICVGSALVAILIGAVFVTGGILWPVFEFVPLTGPFAVGTASAHLVDHSRRDRYTPSSSACRELMIQVWYPAENTRGFRRARYRDGRESDYGDSSLALVKTRSFVEAPVAARPSKYPVLLFDGPVNRFQNTFETEELASHGFIVVGIDHPYDSDLVICSDGRRVPRGSGAVLLDFTSDSTLASSRRLVEQRLSVRVADAEYVLSQLKRWNQSPGSRLFEHLDMDRIGMFGHSFGGAVTAEMCRTDARVRAGINMDGTIFGSAKIDGVPGPYFTFFTSPRPSRADEDSQVGISRRASRELERDYAALDQTLNRYGGYFLQVPGMEHMNFTDCVLFSQVRARVGAGPINVRSAHLMVNRITLAFFRRELLHDRSASVDAIAREYAGTFLHYAAPLGTQAE